MQIWESLFQKLRVEEVDRQQVNGMDRSQIQKSWNWLIDHKGPENINNTKTKYKETSYVLHTALTQAVVKINRF